MPEKTIFGGMDTGGGVGFGIPADYSGGVQEAEPDPVISAHNEMAKKKLGKLIAPPMRVAPSVLTDAKELPENNPIRIRAQEFEKQFSPAFHALYDTAERLEDQKVAALALRDLANNISTEAREKQQEWEAKVSQTAGARSVHEEYDQAISQWKTQTERILQNHGGLRLWEVSPKFSQSLVKFAVEASQEPFGEDRHFDEAVSLLDDAIKELHEVNAEGGGDILSAYQKAQQEYADKLERLKQMDSDVQRAIERGAKKSSGEFSFLSDQSNPFDDLPAPGYRLALDTSPRVCGSCRFFEWQEGTAEGHCHAFGFTAKANYTCDAWQAQSLSAIHTAVRDEGQKDMNYNRSAKQRPLYTSSVDEKDGTPKEMLGRVPGQTTVSQNINESEIEVHDDFNYSIPQTPDENAALRFARNEFLPNDLVYSRALRTLAIVQDVAEVSGNKVYSLKLVDSRGGAWGSGISYGEDLQPRSKSAMKMRPRRRAKSDDLQDMVEVTRSVYRALEGVVQNHEDLLETPLSNKDVLTPLQQDMLKVMEDPMFDNITTGPKRKYFRALQNATHSVGAARQVLFEGYRTISTIRKENPSAKSQMRDVMLKTQRGAYERLKSALKQVHDALTMESATHGDPAPGIKIFKTDMTKKELQDGMFELVAANVSHDDTYEDDTNLDDNELRFTVTKTYNIADANKSHFLMGKMIEEARALESKGDVQIDIESSETTKNPSARGKSFTVSVKFLMRANLQ